ncbi:MAG: glycosyltransferase [Lachnospiraceae bacterium]
MNQPKVSVIVPVYKTQKFLKKCLESILNQSLQDIEVIVVDEGDLDECRAIIDYFELIDDRVVAPHEKNGGYGASCNKGFELARGEYIAIVESDDFVEPTMYEELYNYAKKVGADVVKGPYYEYFDELDGQKEVKRICEYAQSVTDGVPKDTVFSVRQFPQLLTVHASLWTGLYKNSYMKENNIKFVCAKGGAYVDVGFRIDTLVNTDKVAWYEKPFYDYRITNEDSTTNNFNLSSMITRWEEVYEKYSEKKELFEKAAPHILRDEYLNTIGWILDANYDYKEEDYARLIRLYDNISEQDVKEASGLTKTQRKKILEFKKNPKYVEKLVKEKRKIIFGTSKVQRLVSFGEDGLRLERYKKCMIIWAIMLLISSFGAFHMLNYAIGNGIVMIAYIFEILSILGIILFYVMKIISSLFWRRRRNIEKELREIGLL